MPTSIALSTDAHELRRTAPSAATIFWTSCSPLADERVACTNALYILPRHWTGHIPVA
jgi:hypothetical protein